MKSNYWVIVCENGFVGCRHFDDEWSANMAADLCSALDDKEWHAKEVMCG